MLGHHFDSDLLWIDLVAHHTRMGLMHKHTRLSSLVMLPKVYISSQQPAGARRSTWAREGTFLWLEHRSA